MVMGSETTNLVERQTSSGTYIFGFGGIPLSVKTDAKCECILKVSFLEPFFFDKAVLK